MGINKKRFFTNKHKQKDIFTEKFFYKKVVM